MTRLRTSTAASLMLTAIVATTALPVVAQEASPAASPPSGTSVVTPAVVSPESFRAAMRKLWEDHITWTRLFIVSKATVQRDLPDLDATVRRLLANQTDIGNAIKPFYGEEAGTQLTTL